MIKYKKIEHDLLPLFQKLKEKLLQDKDILFAYLFGSYGRGNPHGLSDVDIAVYLGEARDFYLKKLELLEVINKTLLTDEVDLVILNQAPNYFQYEILQSAKLIFSRNDEKRIQFEVKTMKLYFDLEPLHRLAEKVLLNKIREGTYGY